MVAEWLAAQPEVEWVELRQEGRLHNWQAAAIVQAGANPRDPDASSAGPQAQPDLHPIWEAGLRGEGQLLGVGDSGVGEGSQIQSHRVSRIFRAFVIFYH